MPDLPDADGYLFDLDGTLVSGGVRLPWADALARIGDDRWAIVTNDAEHTPAQIATMLDRLGLDVPAARIAAAGAETIALIAADMPGAAVLVAGSVGMRALARHHRLAPARDRVDAVFLGRDRRFSYATLRTAANAVLAGARLYVANPDTVHPGAGGEVVPETGALAAALLACTGPVPHVVVGKPGPRLFEIGLAMVGTTPGRTVMVGDNPETDGVGARRLGLRYHPVGRGSVALNGRAPCPEFADATRHGTPG